MPAVPLFSSLLLLLLLLLRLLLLHELQQSWIWDGDLNTAGTSRIPEAARSEIEPKAWCRSIMMKTQKLFAHDTLSLSLSLSLSLPKFKTRNASQKKILQLLYKSAQVCALSDSLSPHLHLLFNVNSSCSMVQICPTNFPFYWPCLYYQGQGFCV